MRQNLLFLFMLISSTSLFTACSDDEDTSWKELPQGEIKADKVELSLNGELTTGTINFNATGHNAALLEIKNVIDGYSDVAVNVTMSKQDNGSFNLSGTKEITTKPVTKAENTPAPLLTVTVDGTITQDGKLTIKIDATGAGLYIGTYAAETLLLTYSESALVGKQVVFDATDGNNISLLLKDIIPGEKETTITGIQIGNDGFSGTAATTNAEVKYTGTRKDKVLTLNLNVTMKDPGKWAKTYGLSPYISGPYEYEGMPIDSWAFSGAMYSNWKAAENYSNILSLMFRATGGILLPQVLKTVTLEPNGNIGAEYCSGSIKFEQDWVMGIPITATAPTAEFVNGLIPTSGWKVSPKNLAYWYEKEGVLYIKLNIAAIIAQEMGNDSDLLAGMISEILKGNAASLRKILKEFLKVDFSGVSDATFNSLLSWVNNGFPMTVETKNGHTYMSLNKKAFDSIFTSRTVNGKQTSDMQEIWDALVAAQIIPQEMVPASYLLNMISSFWGETTEFNLGLDLQAK